MKTWRRNTGIAALVVVLGGGCVMPLPSEDVSESDLRLEEQIRRQLQEDPVTSRYNVGVYVRDGVATLEGAVPSGYVHSRATAIARSVPGVQNLIDKLAPW